MKKPPARLRSTPRLQGLSTPAVSGQASPPVDHHPHGAAERHNIRA